MKVLLITDYKNILPTELRSFYNSETMTWRYGEVVSFVENNSVPQNRKPLITFKNSIVKVDPELYYEDDAYLFTTDNVLCKIVEVDTSRPWTILDYDGSEYIQYLDVKMIDNNTNYCELPT